MDFFASESQFLDHLIPIWREMGGEFTVSRPLYDHAVRRGIPLPERGPLPGDGPVLVASYGDIRKVRAAGRRRIAFIEHGIGQSYVGGSHPSYSGGGDRADIGLFLVPNENAASQWRRTYPQARVEVIGCPKLDAIPEYKPQDPPIVAVSFHWNCELVPETMGTFAQFSSGLPALASGFHVIGHGHPRAFSVDGLARRYYRMGIEPEYDFDQVLATAALYVCDNSSSLYEFAATGRPVVVLNGSGYRRDVDHGLRFWEASKVGVNCDDPRQLVAAVTEALQDDPQRRADREAALDIVYAYRHGAAARAAAVLADWEKESHHAIPAVQRRGVRAPRPESDRPSTVRRTRPGPGAYHHARRSQPPRRPAAGAVSRVLPAASETGEAEGSQGEAQADTAA